MDSAEKHDKGNTAFLALLSIGITIFLVTLILSFPDFSTHFGNQYQTFIAKYFSQYLIWIVTLIMVATMAIMISPWGKIRLGLDSDRPEFGRFSWFAMLFSAGVGTGIMFWGVAEPIFHLQANPFQAMEGVAPLTHEAGLLAQRITLFHWGLHGWAIYSLTGLCLGYFAFRKGLPLTVSSALHPLIGDRIYGPIGYIVDLLAVFSTLFGTAVTLGLGASQMGQGIEFLFGIEATPGVKLTLIIVVSMIATMSAVSGIGKGIKKISELNIWLTAILLGLIILIGPTMIIIGAYIEGTADYFQSFIPMGLWADTETGDGWQGAWTLFYWGWWISWGPYVGMFMARISRGRTIREYLLGTMLAPTLTGFFFLTVLGTTALNIQLEGTSDLIGVINNDMTQSLFAMFEVLNDGWLLQFMASLATILVITWFVTSSDSATLVICTIVTHGAEEPARYLRIFWGAAIALVAAPLLWFGGLRALQAASTIIALPFAIVIVLMLMGVAKSLWESNTGLNQGQDSAEKP